MNKIIFLDIDGVLNSQKTFIDNHKWKKIFVKIKTNNIEDIVTREMLDIDLDKVFMLRDICNLTGAKIVISSCWRNLTYYILVEEKLISLGLPIIGTTPYIDNNRGEEIRKYLEENKVDNFIILDDDIFKDFYELENYLIKTSFYEDGLTYDAVEEAVRVLRRV